MASCLKKVGLLLVALLIIDVFYVLMLFTKALPVVPDERLFPNIGGMIHARSMTNKTQSKNVARSEREVQKEGNKTTADARAVYLKNHVATVAVFPGVLTRDDASRMHESVDRRWRKVKLAHVKELAHNGGDDDNLVDSVDEEPSYAADVISNGRCTAIPDNEEEQFATREDCDFVEKFLRDTLTPLVEQKVKEWRSQGATDLPEKLYACDSFVKRYMPGERHELHAHRDRTSLITANVLLTDPHKFEGGLEMYPDADVLSMETELENNGFLDDSDIGQGVFLEHGSDTAIGELIMHRGSLWHGVRMLDTEKSERYSWITWYSPRKKNCEDYHWRNPRARPSVSRDDDDDDSDDDEDDDDDKKPGSDASQK